MRRRQLVILLSVIAVGLVLANVFALYLKFGLGYPSAKGFVPLFDLDAERNVPTYFASTELLLAAALLGVIAGARKVTARFDSNRWAALAAIFVYLSIDEATGLHEMTIGPLRSLLGASGFFYFTWVVPASLLIVLLTVFYWKLVMQLPLLVRQAFILAASIYVVGALGFEFLEGYWADQHGMANLIFAGLATIEETLEMAGLIVFIWGLLEYLRVLAPSIELRIEV